MWLKFLNVCKNEKSKKNVKIIKTYLKTSKNLKKNLKVINLNLNRKIINKFNNSKIEV